MDTRVLPGAAIPTEGAYLRGHGTQQIAELGLVASVAGVVHRVNRLISVKPASQRYPGEVGDVVIGRVVHIGQKSWLLDCNTKQHAVLSISSAHLPDGVQRRRTYADQLNMRQLYAEGDLLSAEVQSIQQDGALAVHTRSMKYGKLRFGSFVRVSASLMRRSKQHFHTLPDLQVLLILGMNGYIWIAPAHAAPQDCEDEEPADAEAILPPASAETRQEIAMLRNVIVALAKAGRPIHIDSILLVYDYAKKAKLTPTDLRVGGGRSVIAAALGLADEGGGDPMDADAP